VVNLLLLVPLSILTVGVIAVEVLAGWVGDEATRTVAALRGFRDLRPALVELREETARARALAEYLRQTDR
jgi:hypothetical protein